MARSLRRRPLPLEMTQLTKLGDANPELLCATKHAFMGLKV
jgi:hypothetical protein